MGKRGPVQLPRAERFWARVDKTSECWLWTGVLTVRGGYGHFYDDDQRLRRAHRVAWELARGPIPDGLVVRHRCDQPRCVQLDHLELGTQAENLQDMVERGRSHKTSERGEARYNAVLSEALVSEARRARAAGENVSALARRVGVDPELLAGAARGVTWRHVETPAVAPPRRTWRQVTCPDCGADRGEPCQSLQALGRTCAYPHKARMASAG